MREQISRAKQMPRSETLQEHNRDQDKSPVTDNELINYIDNIHFEKEDNFERYGFYFMNDEVKETKQGRKYIVFDYDQNEYGDIIEDRIYLDEEDMGKKLSLEDIIKRNFIKNFKNIDIKMKLIQPKIYNDISKFYLTINPL